MSISEFRFRPHKQDPQRPQGVPRILKPQTPKAHLDPRTLPMFGVLILISLQI